MAIAFDAASTAKVASGTSLSWSHTCTGANRALIVGLTHKNGTTYATAITYNGVSLTKAILQKVGGSGSQDCSMELWYLLAPASGSNTISVIINTSTPGSVGGACSFTGADQELIGTFTSQSFGANTSASLPITTTRNNSFIVDVMGEVTGGAATPDGSQTQRWNDSQSVVGAGSTKQLVSAGATTMSWSWSTSAKSGICAIEVYELVTPGVKTGIGSSTDQCTSQALFLNVNTPFYRAGIGFTTGSYTRVDSHCTQMNWDRGLGDAFEGINVGKARVTLDNFAGQFSPDNPDGPYYGYLIPGKPLQIDVTWQSSRRILFTGAIEDFKITPALGKRKVDISAKDNFDKVKRAMITTSAFIGWNVGSLFVDVLSYCGLTTSSIDTISDTVPFAWWTDADGDEALNDIIKVGNYKTFMSAKGILNVRNKYYDIQGTTVASFFEFKSMDYTFDKSNIINRATIKAKPRAESTAISTIAWLDCGSKTTLLSIPASSSITFTVGFVDPAEPQTKDVPATSVSIIQSSDFRTTIYSHGGTDTTSTTSVGLTLYAASALCTVYNGYDQLVYLKKFQLSGYSIQGQPDIIQRSDNSSSQALYDVQGEEIETDLIGNADYAGQYANYITQDYPEPRATVGITIVNCFPAVWDIELGDLISVVESNTFVNSSYTVMRQSHKVMTKKGLEHSVTYDLRFWRDRQWLILDSVTRGILDTNKLGW